MACSPFGRGLTRAKFDASQYRDQPANFWFPATGSTNTQKANSSSSSIRPDGGDTALDALGLLSGAGTVVAILDTGIQKKHRAFNSYDIPEERKIILCKNFIESEDEDGDRMEENDTEENCGDVMGHGTACAGLACGFTFNGVDENGDVLPGNQEFSSPAPGARLMVCKIGQGDDTDESEDLIEASIRALKFIVDFNSKAQNKDKKVNVISISFALKCFNKDLARAVHQAIDNDIIVVCCASNDGANLANPIGYPARLGHVLCIGACDKHGQPANLSSEGREVDFVELGEKIWAPVSSDLRDNEVAVLNGTSFATPSIAGLICVLIQDLKRLSTEENQFLWEEMHNVWCMRDLLKSMSVMRGHHDSAKGCAKGYGKVISREYFKKGDEEKIRICKEILGK